MNEDAGRRRYDSTRRELTAEQTRATIAHAARAVFLAKGWAATTVREVAAEAGVSIPTVYAAYGGKAALALALADSADLDAADDGPAAAPDAASAEGGSAEAGSAPPVAQLAAMVRYDRRLFERSGDLIRLALDASRDEPLLAEAYRRRRREADAMRVTTFESWAPGTLRSGLTTTDAADIYGALCNIGVYTVLSTESGWSPDRIETWWAGVVARELLADPVEPSPS
jgi:TetR/AcrR family transcriptional regulator, regulator of cefoperazone and chloramphenicol sensitivity